MQKCPVKIINTLTVKRRSGTARRMEKCRFEMWHEQAVDSAHPTTSSHFDQIAIANNQKQRRSGTARRMTKKKVKAVKKVRHKKI